MKNVLKKISDCRSLERVGDVGFLIQSKIILGAFMVFHLFNPPSMAGSSYSAGAWVSKDVVNGKPWAQVEVSAHRKKVYLTFLKETKTTPPTMGIIFLDPSGNKTIIELKAIESTSYPIRYEGNLNQVESFIGFEIRLPFSLENLKSRSSHFNDSTGARDSKTLASDQMIKIDK